MKRPNFFGRFSYCFFCRAALNAANNVWASYSVALNAAHMVRGFVCFFKPHAM